MKFIKARSSGFAEKPYDMSAQLDRDGRPGPTGISRKVFVADGPDQDKLKFSEEVWVTLTDAEKAVFDTLGTTNFGAIISATFTKGDGVGGYSIEGIRIEHPYNGTVLVDRLTRQGQAVFDAIDGQQPGAAADPADFDNADDLATV